MCNYPLQSLYTYNYPLQLSADNFHLREELSQEAHHHELTRRTIEREIQQRQLMISSSDVRVGASANVLGGQVAEMTTCKLCYVQVV